MKIANYGGFSWGLPHDSADFFNLDSTPRLCGPALRKHKLFEGAEVQLIAVQFVGSKDTGTKRCDSFGRLNMGMLPCCASMHDIYGRNHGTLGYK